MADLRLECPAELPGITCDPELMRIVMVNLVNNAVKYGNQGGMVKLKAEKTSARRLKVSVWNEGPGFSGEEKIRLFKRFSRLDNPRLRDKKGSGIGLYLSWHIIQLHGGKIWAESEPGAWACFSFEMPEGLDFCIID
jgi:signal transduction histidine kinase